MPLPVLTKDNLLNGQTITHASLHSAYPGATGASELVGGSPAYAHQAVVINASSGGQRALNASVNFDVPASTIRWVGFKSSGTFVGCAPNGGATPKNFTCVPAADGVAQADRIYCPSHGWVLDQAIVFHQGTPPTGLTEGTTYYVRDATTHTFKVAATVGGVAVSLTGAPSFGCVVAAITATVFAAQGIHRLDTSTIAVPD